MNNNIIKIILLLVAIAGIVLIILSLNMKEKFTATKKVPIILIPGLASTRLYAKWDIDKDMMDKWRSGSAGATLQENFTNPQPDCDYSYDDWHRIWVDTAATMPTVPGSSSLNVANCWRQLAQTSYVTKEDGNPQGLFQTFEEAKGPFRKRAGVKGFVTVREGVPNNGAGINRDWGGTCGCGWLSSVAGIDLGAAVVFGKLIEHLQSRGYVTAQFDTSWCETLSTHNICNCSPKDKTKEPVLTNEKDVNLLAAPYDWSVILSDQYRTEYFTHLKNLIEYTYKKENSPVIILSHSLGCNVISLFFNEFIDNNIDNPSEWKAKYINSWMPVSPPLGGAPNALKTCLSGDNEGMGVLCNTEIWKTQAACDGWYQPVENQAAGVLLCWPDDIALENLEIVKLEDGNGNVVKTYNTDTDPNNTTNGIGAAFAEAKFLPGTLFVGHSLYQTFKAYSETWATKKYNYKNPINCKSKMNQILYQPPGVVVHAVYSSLTDKEDYDSFYTLNKYTANKKSSIDLGKGTPVINHYPDADLEGGYNSLNPVQVGETVFYNDIFNNGKATDLQKELRGNVPIDKMLGDKTVPFLSLRVPELWKKNNTDANGNLIKVTTKWLVGPDYEHRKIVATDGFFDYLDEVFNL